MRLTETYNTTLWDNTAIHNRICKSGKVRIQSQSPLVPGGCAWSAHGFVFVAPAPLLHPPVSHWVLRSRLIRWCWTYYQQTEIYVAEYEHTTVVFPRNSTQWENWSMHNWVYNSGKVRIQLPSSFLLALVSGERMVLFPWCPDLVSASMRLDLPHADRNLLHVIAGQLTVSCAQPDLQK